MGWLVISITMQASSRLLSPEIPYIATRSQYRISAFSKQAYVLYPLLPLSVFLICIIAMYIFSRDV